MIDQSYRVAGSMGQLALGAVLALLAANLLGGTAVAGVVKFPKDHPKITLDVPDDWTVDMTATGLEIRSPEKNSIIVAQTVERNKAVVEGWTKEAVAKLQAFGVVFEEKGKSAPKPPAPDTAGKPIPQATSGVVVAPAKPGDPTKPNGVTKPSDAAKPDDPAKPSSPAASASVSAPAAPAAPVATADAFTFSGAPSLNMPGTSGSQSTVDPGQFSLEALSGFDGKIKRLPKLHYKTVKYLGSTKDGKPVDTELAIYTLSDQRVFLLMQESEPTDNRSVAIAESLRGTKDSAK